MDWDKTLHTVIEFARKTAIIAISVILVMGSFTFVCVSAMSLLWLVRHARIVLGF